MFRIRSRARPVTPRFPRTPLALGLATAWGAAGLVLHMRRVMLREVRQARRVASAAQQALLRPLPPRVDGLRVAAAQLSADRGASIGGDIYEVIPTEHGVRVVMGDVRGHGLAAASTAAAVLGSFREAAHDETDLGGVLRRLDRALARHLREHARDEAPDPGREAEVPAGEEFVTLVLLEIRGDGGLHVLNCGHPWPYLLTGQSAAPIAGAEPLPPVGPFPLPAELPTLPCGRLRPGDALFLHTDGVEEARDDHGRFFPLTEVLAEAVRETPVCPESVLRTVLTRLLRHTGPSPADDVALLVLRNDRRPVAPHAGPPVGHRAHHVT